VSSRTSWAPQPCRRVWIPRTCAKS
jgi:hypothetical protein